MSPAQSYAQTMSWWTSGDRRIPNMDFRLLYRQALGLTSVQLDAASDNCPLVTYDIDYMRNPVTKYPNTIEITELVGADHGDEERSSDSTTTPISSKASIPCRIGVSLSNLADPPEGLLSSSKVSQFRSVEGIQAIGLNSTSPNSSDIIVNTVRLPVCSILDKPQNTYAAERASSDYYGTPTVDSRSNLIQAEPTDYWFNGSELGRNLLKSSSPATYLDEAPRSKRSVQYHQTGSYLETDRQGTESSSLVGSASRPDESEDRNARTNELLEQLLALVEKMSADHRYKLPQTTRPY